MKGSDMVLVGLTFLTGMFAGAYVYVSVFMPAYVAPEAVGITETRFEVAGEMTGSCGSEVCPSFILKADRNYAYVPGYVLSERSPEAITGKLSGVLLRDIEAAARAAELHTLSGGCQSVSTTAGYRYRLVLEGEAYVLDTCNAAFNRSSLATTVGALWDEVIIPQSAPPVVLEEGLFGGVERYLRNQFQWNQE